ncbi:efflux RND transporter periplasmic adaptor subunit [Silanimonas sp.]|uniref:efflux RND transporter periplasmic adaptor subunit n=1 Tax=Silanimonas sp. TaxID=1929290 RepID=UPI0022BE7818|nr:efflux RND transporter periplasmic adaptor subunit [Silanimonas sp.]MCZ8116360.1 efflux RND transporter periplasmic adaptor subunit [Silanimonas sp.]
MPNPLRQRTRWLALATAAVVVLLVLAWWWPRALPVEAVTVARGDLASSVVDLGETRVREPYVITAPVAGRLRRITLDVGDPVAQDAVLAWIDPASSTPLDARTRASLEAALRQARSTRDRAGAHAQLAADEAERTARLWAQRLVSEQTHRAAQLMRREAEAERAAADAGVARIEAELAESQAGGSAAVAVLSPIEGRVLARQVESAKPVLVGEALMEVGRPDALEVVAEFLSQDAALMREGAPAWIEGWGGAAVPARVRRIAPSGRLKVSALGVEERRVDVWLDPAEPMPGAGHGFQVEARVEIARVEGVVRVPVESLVRDGEGWRAWRFESGRLDAVPVAVGLTDGRWREVRSGLAAGDVIVAAPDRQLAEGLRVSPRDVAGD